MQSKAKFYFTIATTSGVPIYRQIIDQVKTLIATGKIEPENFLPSVRQVAAELEINPMTVSKAYSILEREGILESVRGKGMRINQSTEAKEDLQEREKAILPLLREVVVRTSQLSLNPKRVIEMIESLWKEKNDE